MSARMILKFDAWPWGTIKHLFCAPIGNCTREFNDDTKRGTWWKGYDGQTDRHIGRRADGRTYQRHWCCANFLIHECVECNPHFCGVQSRCPSVNPSLRDVWGGTSGKQPLVVHLFVGQNVILWVATLSCPSACLSKMWHCGMQPLFIIYLFVFMWYSSAIYGGWMKYAAYIACKICF